MKSADLNVAEQIERYLRTGKTDPHSAAWPGQSFLDRVQRAHRELTDALVAAVRRRAGKKQVPAAVQGLDVVAFTRRKVEPMVRGLFPRNEQDVVLGLVERSVIFLTPDNIEHVLREEVGWPRSAWDIANLYLGSVGAELLGDTAPHIVGLSQDTKCFVSPAYFEDAEPSADFVVHEVAHIFHNCKRRTAGLEETRRREWLLDVDFHKRETFAYSCEAYARVVELAPRFGARFGLAQELGRDFQVDDERVDAAEVSDLVLEASSRRNGWKVILARCAPPRRGRGSSAKGGEQAG